MRVTVYIIWISQLKFLILYLSDPDPAEGLGGSGVLKIKASQNAINDRATWNAIYCCRELLLERVGKGVEEEGGETGNEWSLSHVAWSLKRLLDPANGLKRAGKTGPIKNLLPPPHSVRCSFAKLLSYESCLRIYNLKIMRSAIMSTVALSQNTLYA